MRFSPIVLLLFAMLGCGSESQPAKTPAEMTPAEKAVVAAVKKAMTPDQLASGDPIVNSVGMVLVPIPAGEFQMGSPDSDGEAEDKEKPQHLVKITKPFYLSVHVVTQQQYEKVMGVRPWQGEDNVQDGPDYPAVHVSSIDAIEFCLKLSEQEGIPENQMCYLGIIEGFNMGRKLPSDYLSRTGYRLPTEAEWEYACRAGTTTVYSFGDDASKLGEHAWYRKNTLDIGEEYAHRVGQKLPNPWGLYDMHGNVDEWCQDWYKPYGSEKALIDPMGPAGSEFFLPLLRVLRGGPFEWPPRSARSASRGDTPSPNSLSSIGFRVARTYP